MFNRFFILTMVFVYSHVVQGQQCLLDTHNTAHFSTSDIQRYFDSNASKRIEAGNDYVPVQIHVIGKPSSSRDIYAAKTDDIVKEVILTNTYFKNAQIEFFSLWRDQLRFGCKILRY